MKGNNVMLPRIIEVLSAQSGVTDVAMSEETQEGNGIIRFDGYLNINNLKSKFVFRETPIMDVSTIGFIFEYTLLKKEKKESLYEAINFFNRTKTGLKATLQTFSKGLKVGVLFNAEIITPHKSESLSNLLQLIIPILTAAPVLFSKDLSDKGMNHKSISGK
ncbi:hypothetical protein SNQ38_004048 [Cronobacter sakazakii]|nr:hypothetical protein [Cronobacter sakazakii]